MSDGACRKLEPHVGEFDLTGRPMKGWVMAAADGASDEDAVKLQAK
jgi:hypothetical protein